MKYISRTLPLFFLYNCLQLTGSGLFGELSIFGKRKKLHKTRCDSGVYSILGICFSDKKWRTEIAFICKLSWCKNQQRLHMPDPTFFLFESFFCNLVEILILIYKRRSILTRVLALIHIFITFYLYRTVRSFVVYNPSSFSKPLCSIQTRAGDRASCPCASHKKPKVWQFSSVSQEIVCYTFLGFLIEQERGSLKPIHKNYN